MTLPEGRIEIIKEGVRILRPSEFAQLREGSRQNTRSPLTNSAQIDACLYTGMRYVELQRLHENPTWFMPTGFVALPKEAILKSLRHQKERWVRLNPKGVDAVKSFLGVRQLPSYEGWTKNLRRWAESNGLTPGGLGPKTLRKTWESWLVYYYPERMVNIFQNQGHTAITSIAHYLNMPFLPEDREAMRPYVEGMF